MTVGFHSPMPPQRTGVADYSAALLAALSKHGRVTVGAGQGDVHLYHLGNNQLHRDIYRQALETPGVVVLHDAVLHHFFLGSMEHARYVGEFVFNYGEWDRGLAENLWASRAGSGYDERYFRYPMLRRIAERSRAVVVHNPAAARIVLRHAPGARVVEVPHLYAPPPVKGEPATKLGSLVFAVIGFLRESKRLPTVLKAFHEVRKLGIEACLLVAGEFVSSDLARLIEPLMARPNVHRIPWTGEQEFWSLASTADVCINLRSPSAGETSGIAVRMMGLGKAVILTESEEISRFPGGACLRVSPGVAEFDELLHHMVLLARLPVMAREIGRLAARHIHCRHNVTAVAESYWKVLCDCRN